MYSEKADLQIQVSNGSEFNGGYEITFTFEFASLFCSFLPNG